MDSCKNCGHSVYGKILTKYYSRRPTDRYIRHSNNTRPGLVCTSLVHGLPCGCSKPEIKPPVCITCGHEICYDEKENVWYHNTESIQDLSCGVGFPDKMCGCKEAKIQHDISQALLSKVLSNINRS